MPVVFKPLFCVRLAKRIVFAAYLKLTTNFQIVWLVYCSKLTVTCLPSQNKLQQKAVILVLCADY